VIAFISKEWTYSNLNGVFPGWFFGYFIDLSDLQWSEWRKNWMLLLGAFSAYVGVSRIIRHRFRPALRLFYLVSGIGGMFFMHGFGALWLLTAVIIAFLAARVARLPPLLAWALHVAMLLGVHFGYVPYFSHFVPYIGFWMVRNNVDLITTKSVLYQGCLTRIICVWYRMDMRECCHGRYITKC
jgi:hypothetical protein